MQEYKVWVMFSGCAQYTIMAENEEEARDIAIDQADVYDCMEWDYDAEVEEG